MRNETTLDDLAAVIGYTSTREVAAWFAGRALYVPQRAASDHPLAVLLGMPVLRALVAEFGGEQLRVPTDNADQWAVRDRRVAEQLAAGATVAAIAAAEGLSDRRVQQLRDELVLRGWVTYAEGYRAAAGRGRWRVANGARPEILGTGEVVRETGG